MKISATIVVYNENEATLNRVIHNIFSIEYEIILVIVDNSSEDTLRTFCEGFPEISYIFTGKNLGFGKGHNVGFKSLNETTDIHMVINPDIYFESRQISKFLLWFSQSSDISLALPKVCNPDGTIQNVVRNIPTPLTLIKRKLHLDQDTISIEDNMIIDIPFAHGCFMVFQTDSFKKLRGFDEKFFMYMEDIDIFIRAKEYGRTVINTNYKIYHEYRKGSSKSFKLLWWHLVSAWKFFR